MRLSNCLPLLFVTFASLEMRAADSPYDRKQDVIYGRKYGMALTMDVFQPKEKANGLGVVFVVSGGWFSGHDPSGHLGRFQFLLDRGYTVFSVVHGSQPKFSIPEILEDMNRAVRFIRFHAKDYGIDSARIGVTGASAGGHLSLMLGTAGSEGKADAKDPIDRVSSRVQAVAGFFPPTDFLGYGKAGENAVGRGILWNFAGAFDFKEFDPYARKLNPVTDEEKITKIGRDISPINHVSADDPPTLLI
ncbi:MAG TPA: alpha/beta hydrolase, partial [Chthoniobacteraceae bacterium]|nr:alpha/beta hydrolase [Chthoniobacteraceae bacterium]